ncbi:hypothetical protein [Arcicella rigui]|uniref:Uncharacterized protein n=1 Tax=Arcicella rigui TaxID=797020 RepID=A0ABU5QGE3_9BACT|nr:hypothetical protein [Arcicella rigui]MEA5141934.1 hypothetical protein [Arcicella rigui]
MATTSETGHAVNVKNFFDLINFCKGFGTQYQPSKLSIQIPSLESTYLQAKEAIDEIIRQTTAYNIAINERALLFKDNRTLSTRLINAFEMTDAPDATKKDVKGFNRKLQGKRASAVKETNSTVEGVNAEEPKTISSSQTSFNQQVEHLKALVALLESEPSYQPNEGELKVSTLKNLISQQNSANEQVSTAYTALSNARLLRDRVLYGEGTSLYNISLDIKKYIKAAFGASSQEYKQVTGVSIKDFKKK